MNGFADASSCNSAADLCSPCCMIHDCSTHMLQWVTVLSLAAADHHSASAPLCRLRVRHGMEWQWAAVERRRRVFCNDVELAAVAFWVGFGMMLGGVVVQLLVCAEMC